MVWSTWTFGPGDAKGRDAAGGGGGSSGSGGVLSGLTMFEVVADGSARAGRSIGSLSSTGRDQGSICSDRVRVLRFLGRSEVGVEGDEAMSGRQSAAGVAGSLHSRSTGSLECPLPPPVKTEGTWVRVSM